MKLILRGCRFLDSPDTALASMLKERLCSPHEAPRTERPCKGGLMSIPWETVIDEALGVAEKSKRPVLLDFTAAPA